MADKKDAKKDEKPEEKKEGADGAAPAEGAEGDAPKKRFTPKKIALFVGAPVLVLALLGVGAWKMGFLDKFLGHGKPSCENVKEGDKDFAVCQALQAGNDAATPGVFTDIPPMIVNLSSTGKQPRFLKISLKVETENAEEQKKLEAVLPRVVDQFQMYLRELRIEDLRGTSGIYRMKIELLSRIRAAAANIKIRDVLFQEILVQ